MCVFAAFRDAREAAFARNQLVTPIRKRSHDNRLHDAGSGDRARQFVQLAFIKAGARLERVTIDLVDGNLERLAVGGRGGGKVDDRGGWRGPAGQERLEAFAQGAALRVRIRCGRHRFHAAFCGQDVGQCTANVERLLVVRPEADLLFRDALLLFFLLGTPLELARADDVVPCQQLLGESKVGL